ncbi:MAG: hypothetical protein ACI9VR_001330 [Cognaticolwellia sp.]
MAEHDESKGPEQEPLAPLLGEAVMEVFSGLTRRGRRSVGDLAKRGRERLEANQARKDVDQLYQKLGRETLRLVQAGEVTHPGLMAGVDRITQHERRLQDAEARVRAESSPGPAVEE